MKYKIHILLSGCLLFALAIYFIVDSLHEDSGRIGMSTAQEDVSAEPQLSGAKAITVDKKKKNLIDHMKNAKELKQRFEAAAASPMLNPEEEAFKDYLNEAEATLDEMIEEQEPNLEWSERVTAEASQVLQDEEYIGTSLLEVSCGTTLCKMILTHIGKTEQRKIIEGDFSDKGSWDGDQYGNGAVLEDGTLATFIYFTKENDFKPFIEMKNRLAMKGQK